MIDVPDTLEIENEVLKGGNGELFLAGGAHGVLEYLLGVREISQYSIESFRRNLEDRCRAASELGASYVHVIYPDKHTVLRGFFPIRNFTALGDLYLAQVKEHADSILYLRDILPSNQPDCFIKTDTHLSDLGHIITATAIASRLTGTPETQHVPELRAKITTHRHMEGDLGSKLVPPVSSLTGSLQPDWPSTLLSNNLRANNGIVDITLSPNAKYNRRLLIFGDSFGRASVRVLSFFFQEVIFLRTPYFHREIFDQIAPDCLITENVERYLSFVSADENRPSFFMYPYTGSQTISYEPTREFAEVFSAVLSYPRKPYRDFRLKYQLPPVPTKRG